MLSRFLAVLAVIVLVVVVGFTAHRRNSPPATSAYNSAPDKAAPSSSAEQPSKQPADQTTNRDDTVGTSGTDRSDKVMTTDLFRRIAKAENPVVVAITAQSRVPAGDLRQYFGDDDFFSRFFGGRPQLREQLRHTLGSGFLINPDGEILTNSHVVAEAEEIRVALFNDERRIYPADVIGRDALTDSALIKLKNPPANLPAATLGDSDTLEPGDWVMAIGNPFELGHTVTVGVISYKGRPFATSEGRFQNMLQTDASINPGNSGGPLVNMAGEVIGINTAILTETSSYAGVGFALPSNTVAQVYNQLIGPDHRVARGSIGIEFNAQPSPAIQRVYGVGTGVTISNVVAGSPAEQAGLKVGDTIISVDGKEVKSGDELVAEIASRKPGSKAKIGYVRNSKKDEASVTVADRSKLFASRLGDEEQSDAEEAPKESKLGATVRAVTPELADRLDIPAGKGVAVQEVKPGSFADDIGLNRGDIVLEINKVPVNSPDDFTKVEGGLKSGQDVVFLVRPRGAGRQDGTIFLAGTLP